MAGVAGPLCVRDRWGGLRFILGLLAGESVASFIVAVIVLALGWLLRLQFGTFGAWEVVAVIVTVLGVADVIGRTPSSVARFRNTLSIAFRQGVLVLFGAST